ncbi:unnamed protein product [Ectocarpus sp. CCAP 1310/34]|nr:unnamed protein product [Ectocarpus sp. CCAP 1310/34]
MFVRAPRFDAVRLLRFRCSGAAAPVPLLRCRCSGAAVASPTTTKLTHCGQSFAIINHY